jgi:hypothetical protein
MGSDRFTFAAEQFADNQPAVYGPAFTAVPAMMLGVMNAAACQQQIYQWAFEQARQTVQARRPAPIRDLFAIMN